jgi:hypothetical protein
MLSRVSRALQRCRQILLQRTRIGIAAGLAVYRVNGWFTNMWEIDAYDPATATITFGAGGFQGGRSYHVVDGNASKPIFDCGPIKVRCSTVCGTVPNAQYSIPYSQCSRHRQCNARL